MNELTLINFNGIEAIDSRQVAEAVGKAHKNLLQDIRTYCEYLGELNFQLTDFFIKSTYITEQNKEMPCYLCTRKGCEMIANKLTGQKGVAFTALYINAFHSMEEKLTKPVKYGKKSTSAGEVASLIKTLRSIMKDQKSEPEKIAFMAKGICDQFGVNLPEKFVEKKRFDGQLFLIEFTER